MFLAKVSGHVWGAQRWPSLEGLRLLTVTPYCLPDKAGAARLELDASATVVVADTLGAGPGQDVVVAYGHAARSALDTLQGAELPKHAIDAAVVAIVDEYQYDSSSS